MDKYIKGKVRTAMSRIDVTLLAFGFQFTLEDAMIKNVVSTGPWTWAVWQCGQGYG